MIRHFSTALGGTPEAFTKSGVFDGFIEVDTKLYIDPHLLEHSTAPEICEAAQHFRAYFEEIIKILKPATSSRTVFWRQAVRRLTFREIPQLSLGYSKDDVRGSAIGPALAYSITTTAKEIIDAGVEDPEIFELIGLLEEGVGADRISDMTASVILKDLLRYSHRITTELKLINRPLTFQEAEYQLPFDQETSRHVVLVPTDILRNLPVAHDWSEIDIVCSHNQTLRRKVNQLIGNTWRHATRRVSKQDLRAALLSNPGALQDLIEQYKDKSASAYDFQADPEGEINWHAAAQDYIAKYPLDLSFFHQATEQNINALVEKICDRFKQLVEDNGLSDLFYGASGRLKHERAAQLLYFGIADAYCEANDLDLSREPNAGRGPVDFKISRGYKARVTVEVKYSSNAHLEHGYSSQLPTYQKAERTSHGILLVIITGEHRKKLQKLKQLQQDAISAGRRAPQIIIVDGRKRKSASKLRAASDK